MVTKEAYQQQVETQLKEWCAEVEKMLAEASRAQVEPVMIRLQAVVAKQGVAQQRLQGLKQADINTWETHKVELDSLITELAHELDHVRSVAQKATIHSIGWAEGIATEDQVESIGWAEGIAKEHKVDSIGWAEGIAEEDSVESVGWAEGYEKKE